ncbi:hypothetical protein [Marinobacter mobilis]|uniref:Lipoprotein n=1 Tax=Marinobacter mobilis TaxID=488533 RepID=A0A1H2SR39_9GAMM|nr:hypothetical protein [Marinobacter mobilis]SDW34123.1 hypothetical protein SAMN04487960_102208 [Marinobacter mobilis]
METKHKNPAFSLFRNALLLTGLLGLAACGGGGGGGDDGSTSGSVTFNTSQASVSSEDEAKAVSEASRQAASQGIYAQDAFNFPIAAETDQVGATEDIVARTLDLVLSMNIPSAADTQSITGSCGGSADITAYSQTHFRVDYKDYCEAAEGGNMVLNGWVDMTFTYSGETLTSYDATFDITYNYLGESQNSAGSISCSGDMLDNCTYTTDFTGSDGERYRVTNVTVSGDNNLGFTVSARVYHQELGYVDFQGTDLIICTDGTGFSTGTITVTDASGVVATATFSGCGADYTVTYDGVGYPVPQQ